MVKSKTRSTEECTQLFEIEVPAQAIAKAFDEVYAEIMKYANIPGFRVGRAPTELVKRHYTKDARSEVLKRLIPEAYRSALEEHKIVPMGLPEISDVVFEDEKALSFRAKVLTRPEFKLKEYKGLQVKRGKVGVTDADIDRAIENLRGANAIYVDVKDRALAIGDYAVCDLECHVDGRPVHKKRENLWLYLDKDALIPELSEKMAGMKRLEERDIDAVFPEKYPDKAIAGKAARYHVFLKGIKSRQLPNADDDFAKGLGKTDLDDLRKEIAKELEAAAKVNAEIEAENTLLNGLMDENVFTVPSSMVKRQLESMVEDTKRRLSEKGIKPEELSKRDEELKERFKKDAERHVRLLFILDEIAVKEGIDAGDEDLKAAYKSISAQTGKTEEEIRDYYEEKDLVDNLKSKIREERVIAFLLKEAKIIES